MLAGFLTSVLPGARDLRPPLIAGALWTIFFWIVFGARVPEPENAAGLAKRTYELASTAGPLVVTVVVGLLVFVVGILAVPLSEALAGVVGAVGRRVKQRIDWQLHAQKRRQRLGAEACSARRRAKYKADQLRSLSDPDAKRKCEEAVRSAQEEYLGTQKLLRGMQRTGGLWIRRNQRTLDVVGTPATESGRGLEIRIVALARREGIQRAASEMDLRVPSIEVEHGAFTYLADDELAERLSEEVAARPIDLLQALDDGPLFQAVDREQSENEVRIAASLPVIAISLIIAAELTPWALLGAAAALVTFTKSAFDRSQLPSRVLNLIVAKGLKTPAMREAETEGRGMAGEYAASTRREEEELRAHGENIAASASDPAGRGGADRSVEGGAP